MNAQEFLQQVEKRRDARFMTNKMIDYAFYDCVTFCLSIYQEMGIVKSDFKIRALYRAFSKGADVYETLVSEIERTESFRALKVSEQEQVGDMLLFNKGVDGHHCALWTGDNMITHCIASSHVTTHSFIPPISNAHTITYRPK